jgi:aminoglycoside phosphotransferase (APT) family kinase protein
VSDRSQPAQQQQQPIQQAAEQEPIQKQPAQQWTADVQVSEQLATDLIATQFPLLAHQRVELLATGWDNSAFAVGSQWLFRFPRRDVAIPGVRREIMLLPRLAAALPLPIPNPGFVGRPSAAYPWPFFGGPLLAGTELAEANLSSTELTRAGADVGRFLQALHDPPLVRLADGAGLPIDPMGRGNPQVRARRSREVLDRLVARGHWRPDPDVFAFLARADGGSAPAPAAADDTRSLVLTHGDLHVRHLLVAADGAVTGVIDWGDLCLASPAVDLSIAYFGFAGAARAALLTAYAYPVPAPVELAARTLAISLAASLLEYAVDDGRSTLLAQCQAGLRRAISE